PVMDGLRLGVAMEARRVRSEKERAVPVADETVGGEADRRLEEAAPRQLAEAAMRQLVRGHRTGDRDGERSLDVHVALHGGPAVHAGAGGACRELQHARPRRAPLCHDQPGTGAATKINWGPGGARPRSTRGRGGGAPTSVLFAACPWTWPTSSRSRPSPTSSSRPTATASPSS